METEDGNTCSPQEGAVATSEQVTSKDTSCGGEEAGSKLVNTASAKKQKDKHGAINGVLSNSDNQCNGENSHASHGDKGDIVQDSLPPEKSDANSHQILDKDDFDDNSSSNKTISYASSPADFDKDTSDAVSSAPVKAVLDVISQHQSDKYDSDESTINSPSSNKDSPDVNDEAVEGNSPSYKVVPEVNSQHQSDQDESISPPSNKTTPDMNSCPQEVSDLADEVTSPSDKAAPDDLYSDISDISDAGSLQPDKAVPDVSSQHQSDKEDSDEGSSPSNKGSPDVNSCHLDVNDDKGSSPSHIAAPDVSKCQDVKDISDESSSPSNKGVPVVNLEVNDEAGQGSSPSNKASPDLSKRESDKDDSDEGSPPSNKTAPDFRKRTCKSCLGNKESENQIDISEMDAELTQFECIKCHKQSSDSQTKASDGASSEQCPICDMMFESSELLDDHLMSPESCRHNKENLSSLNTAKEKPHSSVSLSQKPSECEQVPTDNNNEDVCNFSEQKMQELTLDGSVVDEMEERDQELQRLSEEADSMDESLALDNEAELDNNFSDDKMESTELEEKISLESEDISTVVKEELNMDDEQSSSSKMEENKVGNLEEATKDVEPSSPKDNDVPADDKLEGDDKVVDQVFLPKESSSETQPEIICHEIVDEIMEVPEPEIINDEPAETPKEKPRPVPTSIKPVMTPPPSANNAAVSQNDNEKSNENDVIDITDMDTSEKKASPAKSDAKEKTDSGCGDDDKSNDDDSEKAPGGIKRRFSTGNETLDQDIVEILQDSTKSGGRVTRSMRKPKEDPAEPKKDSTKKGGAEGKKTSGKAQPGRPTTTGAVTAKTQSMTCKLATASNSSDATEIKDPLTTSSNGSLVLQVPASSVQSGAKFIITIPKNNSTNTPPGRYIITVPPTTASPSPKQKEQAVLKASPLSPTSPTINLNESSILETEASTTTTSDDLQDIVDKSSQVESDEAQKMQLRKTLLVAKQTKKVYVKELEEIDNIIFECPKCKMGFPHMLLVQMHMEDCCHHPPTQKPTLHMRIPTEVLIKFFDKEPSQNRQAFRCICCQEVLSFRRYRIGKYYPTLATHFSKHTSPAVRVVNFTEQSVVKKLTDVLTVHSQKAVEWVDYMVPPFSTLAPPVSSKTGILDGFLCTSNKLHQESLLLLEYDSDELSEEIYSMRKQKETKKKKRRGKNAKDEVYRCNWRAAIVKEDHNIVEVTEIGTPKSAFPNEINKSGSLKHSIVHSPSKAKKDSNQKSGKKKKGKSRKDVSKQLFTEDNINRRRSPRKEGATKVFLSLPDKKARREPSLGKDSSRNRNRRKPVSSDDDIILLSSEDDVQENEAQKSAQSKEMQAQEKSVSKAGANEMAGSAKSASAGSILVRRRSSVDDESSRGSMASIPAATAGTEPGRVSAELPGDKDDEGERPPSRVSAELPGDKDNEDERPPSRGSAELPGDKDDEDERPPSRGSAELPGDKDNEDERPPSRGSAELPGDKDDIDERLPSRVSAELPGDKDDEDERPPSRGSAELPGDKDDIDERLPSRVSAELPGDKDDEDERPPSRGSSIICISDSTEEEESFKENVPKMPDKNLSEAPNKTLIPQDNTSTIKQKAAIESNAAQDITNKHDVINAATKQGQSSGVARKAEVQGEDKEVEEVRKKRLVPEAEKDEEDEVMVISDTEEEEEEDGIDLNSDNYDPILLDKHQVKTYFQMSKDEQGIYECALGGCSSCDCVAESDLFEHLRQHIHVERVNPQKRSKTILFKGKVVPQYLKLTKHQIWAHFFSNIVVDSEMEICDEYMQQYKQCRWASCKQRVWTKYGRLSHHLRSHLRFTQIDNKRYQRTRDTRKISSSDTSKNDHAVLQNISKPKPAPIKDTRIRLNDGDEVVCLPEDVILKRYKYGKSPSKNVRGIFSCLVCTFSHHLDTNASAVMTVKKLACHLKQHLPQSVSQNRMCLITPKAMKQSADAEAYATRIRTDLLSSSKDLINMRHLPDGIVASCFDLLKMKVVEPAVTEGHGLILNKDGVLYRCLYSGCLIGVVGDKRSALLKHIKEHRPAVDPARSESPGQNKGIQSQVNQESQPCQSADETASRKRKPSPNRTTDGTVQQTGAQSKQRRIDDSSTSGTQSAIQNSQVVNSQAPTVIDDDDDDVVEVIDDSSQDSNQIYAFEEQRVDSLSQEAVMIAQSPPVSVNNGGNKPSSELPEWTANNRGVNAVTGIEPSRDNPSRSMDELRQNPNDVIICSMPDVEAYFCEHIVKYSSYMPSLSDKVTFGKPSYSCPECGISGLKGVALKEHLESHIGKTIKWKALIKNLPLMSESETELEQKYRTMTNMKTSETADRGTMPSKMKLSTGTRKWEGGRSGVGGNSKHQVKLVGQGVRKARHNFNSILGKIMHRERNIRWGKLARSPVKKLAQNGPGNCRQSFGRSNMRFGNTPIRDLANDLSSQVNQGQSSGTKHADTVKQSHKPIGMTQQSHSPIILGVTQQFNNPIGVTQQSHNLMGVKQQSHIPIGVTNASKQGNHGDSCKPKSKTYQPCEVIDLVDDDPIEIGSVGSDDVEMENVAENRHISQKAVSDVQQGDDLFLTIDDILKEHFTKEEKQRSRKGVNGMNFVVVQYKCRRCNFATLTVLDVPEHVAFHIKRKVILKIKMDK